MTKGRLHAHGVCIVANYHYQMITWAICPPSISMWHLQVADLEQMHVLLGKRLEHALDEAAEQRRQRVDMMTHRVSSPL